MAVTYIDNLLISFPSHVTEEIVHDVWQEVERSIMNGVILKAGVSDMDKTELEALYNWAQVTANN